MEYYTYAYLREDGTPYYIGKGKEDRIYSTCRRNTPPKDKSRIIFIKQNLTEEEAFRHEKYMIAVLGRKDLGTGILRNRTDGGEGVSGRVSSEETRRKLSEAHKGKTLSEEHKIKLSEAKAGRTSNRKGVLHSEESKEKMSKAKENPSEETRRKMSEAKKANKTRPPSRKGSKWWNDGCGNCKMVVECPGNGWRLGRK